MMRTYPPPPPLFVGVVSLGSRDPRKKEEKENQENGKFGSGGVFRSWTVPCRVELHNLERYWAGPPTAPEKGILTNN